MASSDSQPSPASDRRLPCSWLVAWGAAIVYATLYPWAGWRMPTVHPLAFLLEGWPRYWTWLDLSLNFAGYLPLGLFATLYLGRGRPGPGAALAAIVLAALLSCGLEALQGLLPPRIASLSDVLANTAGAAAGATLALALDTAPLRQFARALDRRLPAMHATGMPLLLLWLAVQWHPQAITFASGELGALLATIAPASGRWLAALALPADQGPLAETIAVAATVTGVGLLARDALRTIPGWALALPILAGMLVKSLASAGMLGVQSALAWLNASAQGGLVAGALLLALTVHWPDRPRRLAAILALLLATSLYNLAPPNVYFESTMASWNQGGLANLNGLLRGLATVWPFAALLWCLGRLRQRGPRPIIRRP
jgi:VanZ family protein